MRSRVQVRTRYKSLGAAMHIRIPDIHVGLVLVAVWLCIVLIAAVSYFVFRWWRRHHPAPEREQTYSRQLAARFSSSKARSPRE